MKAPNIKNICPVEYCIGCGACAAVCPKVCIGMKPDKEGFLRPQINEKLCINCNSCYRVCPVLRCEQLAYDKREASFAYGGWSKDENIRYHSSSGGIFSTLSKAIMEKKGIIWGAAFSKDFYSVYHKYAKNAEQLRELSGSKYLQSDLTMSWKKIKKQLSKGINILFCGTPCQVAALKSYLGNEPTNLLTVDFICHGVPSPKVWKAYLMSREKEAGDKTYAVDLRDKQYGWNNYSICINFKNGVTYRCHHQDDLYMKCFLSNLCLRQSCYHCSFKIHHYSDITIGDYWGIDHIDPTIKSNNGISCVVTHSKKGFNALMYARSDLSLFETDYRLIVQHNPSIAISPKKANGRDAFLKHINSYNINNRIKYYLYMYPKIIQLRKDVKDVRKEKGVIISILYALKHRIILWRTHNLEE